MLLLRMAFAGVLCAATASAQPCSVADVRGTYLYQATGSSAQVPARALGLVQFDGSGQATGRMMITIGGVLGAGTFTYEFSEFTIQVNPDCTGQAQYRLKSDGDTLLGPDKLNILVLDEGARIWGQVTESPGRTVFMTAEFQRLGRGSHVCTQSMIRGTYLFRYDGWINQQVMNPRAAAAFVPAIANGFLAIDPEAGTLTGGGSSNWGGTILHTVLKTAGFQVNADCSGTYDYQMQVVESNANMSGTMPIIVAENGDRLIALQTALPALIVYERISIP